MKNRLVDVAFAMTFIPLFIGSGHVLAQPYPQREYGQREQQESCQQNGNDNLRVAIATGIILKPMFGR